MTNYKFDDSIYTKYRTKELLKEVDTDWKTDCKYPYFNVYEDEVYLTQNVHGIPSIAKINNRVGEQPPPLPYQG